MILDRTFPPSCNRGTSLWIPKGLIYLTDPNGRSTHFCSTKASKPAFPSERLYAAHQLNFLQRNRYEHRNLIHRQKIRTWNSDARWRLPAVRADSAAAAVNETDSSLLVQTRNTPRVVQKIYRLLEADELDMALVAGEPAYEAFSGIGRPASESEDHCPQSIPVPVMFASQG